MNKTLKKICKYEKTILLCMILLFAMVVFQNFIFGNMLFVYNDVNDDTFQSYLAAYQLIVNMIKNGNLSLMNLTAGLGSNILSFQTVIFDPFAIILYIVGLIGGIESIPYALVYVQIIRMVCAGLACRYFLSAFPFSKFSRCVGAFLYAFSAFLLSDIGQHYMFSTAAVMIMLLLGLLEHSIRDNRILIPFSIFVAICSIWGIYMSYMILLTCGLYAIVRWIQLKDISIKSAIRFFGPLLFSVIFGMMLSGIILVPSTIYMLTISSRLESSMPFLEKLKLMFSCLDKEQYKTYILRLFSNQIQGSLNQWTGAATSFNSPHIFCSILLPVALIQFFLEKIRGWNKSENRVSIFVYILVLFICATQVGGFIFNAFVDYMTRFTFVLIPFEAYVITWFINAIMKKKIKYVWVNWLTGFLSIILVLKGCEWGQLASSVSAINAIICITLVILTLNMLYFKNSSLNVWAKCVIFLVLAANVSVEGRVSVGFDRLPITKEWYAQNGMNQDINQALNIANKEDSFFRFERSYLAWGIQQAGTYSEVAKYYGVSYYNSLVNKNIGKLRTDILKTAVDVAQVNYGSYSIGSLGMPLDNILADLYGLKYIISDYPTSNNAWKFEKIGDRYLYRNSYLDTAGLLYNDWCTEEQFVNMTEQEKKVFMAKTVMITSETPSFKASTFNNPFSEVKGGILTESIITEESNLIDSGKDFIKLFGEEKSSAIIDVNCPNKEDVQLVIEGNVVADTTGVLKIQCDTGFGFSDLYWVQQSFSVDSNLERQIVMKIPKDTKRLKFSYDGLGNFQVSNMKMLMCEGKKYTNEGVSLSFDERKCIFSGTVEIDETKLFVIPIAVEDGWKAMVDGKEAKILTADYAFIALELDEGIHNIELKYQTPGLKFGIVISIIGLISLVVWKVYIDRNMKKVQSH